MKRILSLFMVLTVIASVFTSCSSAKDKSVLTVNDEATVDTEIFTYFLNEAYNSGSGYTDEQCIEAATYEGMKYLAVNTQFASSGKTLSADEKAAVSKETNALWRMYGKYLTEIGVSKDAFFRIKQYEYCRENLRLSLYDTNGTQPISENYIKQYFTDNYVGIKYFYEELYTPLTDEQLNNMTENEKLSYEASKKNAESRYKFISTIADYVNGGVYTIDDAFMAVTGEVSADISVSATVVGRNDTSFSTEFVDVVFKQSVGSAFIITNAERSYIYFIERVDLLDSEYDFYDSYRERCLAAVSESYFTNEISSWVKAYNTVRHLDKAKKCLSKVKKVDKNKYNSIENCYLFK